MQRGIAGRGKIVFPRYADYRSAKTEGNGYAVVRAAGISDDNFIGNPAHALQATGQILSSVAYDHGKRQPGFHKCAPARGASLTTGGACSSHAEQRPSKM